VGRRIATLVEAAGQEKLKTMFLPSRVLAHNHDDALVAHMYLVELRGSASPAVCFTCMNCRLRCC
jgi:hypothetical protein